jgi:beta-glucosidase
MSTRYPETFLWGVASAGHQVDGGDTGSDTSFLEQVDPTVFAERSGDACRSWTLWERDLDLVAGMGLGAYRFSVEWARIEPERGAVDAAGLDHYDAMVDGCLARGIAPLVTLSHFTSPHWFAADGGWLHPDAPARFAEQCARVMGRIGDRVAAAVTLNEPNLPATLLWGGLPDVVVDLQRATLAAASRAAGVPRYRAANVVLPEEREAIEDGMALGHLAAREACRAAAPGVPVGLSLAVVDDVALDEEGAALRDRKSAECYDRWYALSAGDDLIGVQNYEQMAHDRTGLVHPAGGTLNQMGTPVVPESLGGAVRTVHAATGLPVLVSEHGIATDRDEVRAAFLPPALASLDAAVADGVPVLGYLHWTLMDNFEWIFGYRYQLGLHTVDRSTGERRAKPSAGVLAAEVAARRGVPAPAGPRGRQHAPGTASSAVPGARPCYSTVTAIGVTWKALHGLCSSGQLEKPTCTSFSTSSTMVSPGLVVGSTISIRPSGWCRMFMNSEMHWSGLMAVTSRPSSSQSPIRLSRQPQVSCTPYRMEFEYLVQ